MPNNSPESSLYNELRSNGFNHNAAISVLSNWSGETGKTFDPSTKQQLGEGETGKGRGLAQWEVGGRFDTDPINLVDFASKQGKSWDDSDVQTKFFFHELENNKKFKNLKSDLNNMDIANGTQHFLRVYEGAGKPHTKERLEEARRLDAMLSPKENKLGYTPIGSAPDIKGMEAMKIPSSINMPEQQALMGKSLSPDNPLMGFLPKSQGQKAPGKQTYSSLNEDNPLNQFLNPSSTNNGNKSEITKPGEPSYKETKYGKVPSGLSNLFAPINALRNLANPLGTPNHNPVGLGEMAASAAPVAAHDAINQAKELESETVKELGPAIKYAAIHPGEAAKDVGLGAAKTAENILNVPRNIPEMAEHFGLTKPGSGDISKDLNKFDFGIPEAKTPESKYIRQVTETLPALIPGGKAVGKTAIGIAKAPFSLVKGEDPLIAIKASELEKKITAHKDELEAANESASKAEKEHNEAKGKAEQSGYSPNANRLVGQNKKAGEEIKDIDSAVTDMKKKIDESRPIAPIDKEVEKAESEAKMAHENVKKAEDNKSHIDKITSEVLNPRVSHAEEMGSALKKMHVEEKKAIQTAGKDYQGNDIGYGRLASNVEDKKVTINPLAQDEAKSLIDDLHTMWKEDKRHTKEGKKLGNELASLSNQESMSASDFINVYKSAKGYLHDANMNSRKTGINAEERGKWEDKAEELTYKVGKMRSILKKSIGDDDFSLLERTDAAWRDRVASMYKNPVYRKFMDSELTGENLISSLRGNKKGTQVIKGLVKMNPEILSNALGQIYKKNPAKFFDTMKENVFKEYIDQMPAVKKLIDLNEEAKSNIDKAKSVHERANQNHEKLIERSKEINPQIKAYEKEQSELKASIEKHQSKRTELIKQIKEREDHIKELNAKLKKKELSFENKGRIASELDKNQKKLKELNKLRVDSEGVLRQLTRAGFRLAKKYGAKAIKGALH